MVKHRQQHPDVPFLSEPWASAEADAHAITGIDKKEAPELGEDRGLGLE